MKPLAELRSYLADFATRAKAARWFGASFHVGVCAQICADVASAEAAAARRAYTAEQADREALRELETAMSGGIDASDAPAIRRALAHVRRSAEHDRQVCETLSA